MTEQQRHGSVFDRAAADFDARRRTRRNRGTGDAVDLSEDLLANLERCGHSLPQLHSHRADVTAWERDEYDLVQCVLGIFFFPDMEARHPAPHHLTGRCGTYELSEEAMQEHLGYVTWPVFAGATVLTAVLALLGALISARIIRKHFAKAGLIQ